MKKRIALITVLLMFICTPLGAVSTYIDNSVKVLVNGTPASTNIVMSNGSVFVPLRFMSSQLDAQVSWDSKSRTVYVKKDTAKSYPAPLVVNGSDGFKQTVNQSLALLKSKQPAKYSLIENNVSSINEADLAKSPSNMAYTIGVCSFDLGNLPSVPDKQIQIAGILVHEAHHAWMYNKGLFGVKDAPFSVLDAEILAHSTTRQTIKSLGASDKLMSLTSVDYVIDHSYSGVN